MEGDSGHPRSQVDGEIRRFERGQLRRRTAVRAQDCAPLQKTRGGARNGGVRRGRHPVAPGVVGFLRVPRPGLDGHCGAGGSPDIPGDTAETGRAAGVQNPREVSALGARGRRKFEHSSRIRRAEQGYSPLGHCCGDLLRIGPEQEGDVAVTRDAVHPPAGRRFPAGDARRGASRGIAAGR